MSENHVDDEKDTVLESFMLFAKARKIQIHSSIQPYRFPTHGMGIAATNRIEVSRLTFLLPFVHSIKNAQLAYSLLA